MMKPMLVAVALLAVAYPASAQDYRLPKNGREQTEFYMSRARVDIIQEGPIVTDRRRNEPNNQVLIVIPPMAPAGGTTTVIAAPAGSGSGSGLLMPANNRIGAGNGVVPTGSLPVSGFGGSNISPCRLSPSALPPGATIGVHSVTGKLNPAPRANSVILNPQARPQQIGSVPAVVKRYQDFPLSPLISSGGNSTRTGVHAKLLEEKKKQH